MPGMTHEDDDGDDTTTLIDPATGADEGDPTDNGNGPTAAELEAENSARAAALKQVATGAEAEADHGEVPRMIPKGRFDEVNEERKALAAQLAQANAALAALATGGKAPPAKEAAEDPPAFDLKAALRERLQALASGNDDRALELDEAIQEHTLKQATENARRQYEEAQATMTQQQQAAALKATAAELTALYPQLDIKSADADQDAIDFVVARRDRLMAEGKPAHEALRLAVTVAAKRFGFDGGDESAPTKSDPTAARLLAARQRNAAAAAAQPPELGGKGNRATQVARFDVEKMTDEEFAALPEAEKKRLRGDV